MTRYAPGLILLCVLACGACAKAPPEPEFAERDFKQFRNEVYPVLLRDCGFPECHGAPERFFKVWGPGRTRLPAEGMTPGETEIPGAFDPPAIGEVTASRAMAQSMIDNANLRQSLLLRKPLAVEAGGSGHLGVDKYGRDIYRTADDSGYVALARWVFSAQPSTEPK